MPAPTGLVRVRIPERYGVFHARYPDGSARKFAGGQIADIPPELAKIYGLASIEDELRAAASADTGVPATAAAPVAKQDVPTAAARKTTSM